VFFQGHGSDGLVGQSVNYLDTERIIIILLCGYETCILTLREEHFENRLCDRTGLFMSEMT
jgi:hypothetical protein